MIRIDHIEFGFAVPDEDFAYDLYADWDGFCRRCFERVVEDCLAPYGDDRSLYELERLVLDLGRIPEESFLDEFPGRLKAALQEALPNLRGKVSERTAEDRAANFLFYLACGYPLAEWADRNFNPQEETEWLSRQSSTFYMRDIRKLANLCVKNGISHAAYYGRRAEVSFSSTCMPPSLPCRTRDCTKSSVSS